METFELIACVLLLNHLTILSEYTRGRIWILQKILHQFFVKIYIGSREKMDLCNYVNSHIIII